MCINDQLQKVICKDDKVNSTFIIQNDSNDVVLLIGTIQHNGSSIITQNLSLALEAYQTYSLTVQVESSSCIIATNTHQLGERYSNIIDMSIIISTVPSDTLSFVNLTGCEEYSTTSKSMFTFYNGF